MDEQAFRDAIDLSGYPLQSVVAGWLDDHGYGVSEEWAFVDTETERRRTIDIEAFRSVDDWSESEAGRVAVVAALLIECKQSRSPYVGFEAVTTNPFVRRLPLCGLPHDEVVLEWNEPPEGEISIAVPVSHVLGLTDHAFFTDAPVITTLSKAHPRGKRVELSGEEPYNALSQPLAKATVRYIEHWRANFDSRADDGHYSVHLPVPIAVVDAPLLVVRGRKDSSEIRGTSWMRVVSHEAARKPPHPWRPLGYDVINVVHADFFPTFVAQHLEPFLDDFTRRVHRVQDALLVGKARMPHGGRNRFRRGDYFEWLSA
jgi:hypothetical protein